MTGKYDILRFEVLDSTNDEAARRIQSLDNLSVLSSQLQTAGRGQRGNKWHAAGGSNLTFSVVLKFQTTEDDTGSTLPHLKASEQFVISQTAALSVTEFLLRHGIEASIKWPNDIYVGSHKICGMLIENTLRGSMIGSSIIGIGINVNQTDFDPTLPNPTSMMIQTGKKYHIETLLEEFLDIFLSIYNKYLVQKAPGLREDFLERLWRLDTPAQYIDYTDLPGGHTNLPVVTGHPDLDGKEFTGIIRDISPIGHLLVEEPSGRIREFAFKEIGYVL